MDRRTMVLGLALAAAPALARAADKPPVKLSKAFPYLDKYLDIPPAQRNRFALAYYIRLDGKPAPGIKAFIIEADGRRSELPIDAKGRVTRLPTAAQLATASFQAQVPADAKIGVNLQLEPSLPPASEFNVRDLEQAVAQANAGMARAAGLIAMALPKLTGIGFMGAGSGRARLGDGREVALPIDAGDPFYSAKAVQGAVAVLLAHAPARLTFKSK